jgi:hypothetical protein
MRVLFLSLVARALYAAKRRTEKYAGFFVCPPRRMKRNYAQRARRESLWRWADRIGDIGAGKGNS